MDPAQCKVLLDREADATIREALAEVRDPSGLRTFNISKGNLDHDEVEVVLFLGYDVVSKPRRKGAGGFLPVPWPGRDGLAPWGLFDRWEGVMAVLRLDQLKLGLKEIVEFFKTQLINEELHPGLVTILPLAMAVKDPNNGLTDGDEVLRGSKFC